MHRNEREWPTPAISVCVLSAHRADALARCLDSLAEQVDAPVFEVVVAANGDPAVHDVVHARLPWADVIDLPALSPAQARNELVAHTSGELLFFLDDDAWLRPHVLRDLGRIAEAHPTVGVFGGANLTGEASSHFQVVQGAVLASSIATGPVRRRYETTDEHRADDRSLILCNLAVRRDVLQPFPDLVCAEENGLLDTLAAAGVEMRSHPDLSVFHDRRPTWRGFRDQMHKYGRGRGHLVAHAPSRSAWAFLPPLGLVGGLIAVPALAWAAGPAVLWAPVAYLAIVLLGLVAQGPVRSADLPLAAALTVTLHVSYGTGLARGLASEAARRVRHGARSAPRWPGGGGLDEAPRPGDAADEQQGQQDHGPDRHPRQADRAAYQRREAKQA